MIFPRTTRNTRHTTGVFGNQAQDTGIPADVWRYYLLASRPEKNDAEFNWDDFRMKFTADLNDNLGNFVMRVFKFIQDGCATVYMLLHVVVITY